MTLFFKPTSGDSIAGATNYPVVLEDFEDGDLAEYTGDKADFDVNTNAPVAHGSYSMKQVSGTKAEIYSTPGSGLSSYPDQGETFVFQVDYSSSSGAAGVQFGLQDGSNLYMAEVSQAGDTLNIWEKSGGSYTNLAGAAPTTGAGTFYLEARWTTSNGITVVLYDSNWAYIDHISVTDSTYTDGGLGWRGTESTMTYDYARVIDPHANLTLTNSDIITTSGQRERLWVIRAGSSDWHAFGGVNVSGSTGDTRIYHYTSTDGVSWSADANNPVAGNSTYAAEDACVFYDPDNAQWVLIAEDELNISSHCWVANSLGADSWTRNSEFTRQFGVSERTGIANPAPWYDPPTDTWYLYIEEWQSGSSNPDYIRCLSNSNNPAVASDWVDEGRINSTADWVPKGMFEDNGNPRLYTLQRASKPRQYFYLTPDNGDLTSWSKERGVLPAGAPSSGHGELMPAHGSEGWREYYPEGTGTPWVYSFHLASEGGDDNYDLLKGGV